MRFCKGLVLKCDAKVGFFFYPSKCFDVFLMLYGHFRPKRSGKPQRTEDSNLLVNNSVLTPVRYFSDSKFIFGNILISNRIVHKIAVDILLISRHVNQSVTGKVEEDDFFFACFLAF